MTAKGKVFPIKVGMVQINKSFSNQNYLPLSVGLLQAYAQKHLTQPDNYEFLLPIYRRGPVEDAVRSLLGVDAAFFSTYVWNGRISLEIAKTLKGRSPETVIVFGGPHVPDRAQEFLTRHQFIDIACHGEGERSALAILENCRSRSWDGIPGISFLRKHGDPVLQSKAPRLLDLSEVPSPYLEDVFAPLMDANPEEQWIACWETNRGCPFACTFCDWGSALQSKVYTFDMERLYKEIAWFARHKIEYLFCCDANFGILPRDIQIAEYVAEVKRKYGYPYTLSVQGTKNATERAYKIFKILADAGLGNSIDIALQSVDANTLRSIKRSNISKETYEELQRRFTRDGVETYTDMILGLPGETYDSFANGVSEIIENGQHNRIQFNNLSILPNAEMGDPEYQKRYGMVTVESKPANSHGSLDDGEEVPEAQVMVIATNTMPKDDWVRTRIFAWMTALLYFDKLFQIPLVVAHEVCGVTYRELIEVFCEGSQESFPLLSQIRSFLTDRARVIQEGGPEFTPSKEWLNSWWSADEYLLIKLCVENKLSQFYQEAARLLSQTLRSKFLGLPPDLLNDAVKLNHSLIKLPFQVEDLDVHLTYDIWEFYQSVLRGSSIPLEKVGCTYHIDRTSRTWPTWDDWCREIVCYGNKRGAYLYRAEVVKPEIAGHY